MPLIVIPAKVGTNEGMVCRGDPRSESGMTGLVGFSFRPVDGVGTWRAGAVWEGGLCMNGLDSSALLGMTFGEGWG